MSIPGELARREQRLKKLAEARAKIEARASERFAREQAEYEAKIAAREAKAKATGKKPRGKPPAPPTAGPEPSDQINLTDEDSRIMPVAGGGFEQCYNAQAVVAADSLQVVAADVVRAVCFWVVVQHADQMSMMLSAVERRHPVCMLSEFNQIPAPKIGGLPETLVAASPAARRGHGEGQGCAALNASEARANPA
jgi:hypothetical protein